MPQDRWTNQSQPQTLQIAVFLLYATAFFGVINVLQSSVQNYINYKPWGPLYLAAIVAAVLGGRGIASERKWGYYAGLGAAAVPLILRFWPSDRARVLGGNDLIGLLFDIALVGLLLHQQSREYQRIWFK
ncbi:MAG TPA: hypothetical protein VGO92_00930 [Acidimicrobiales bacterium]|nr:hypothetical protein [Acidimicrobiales bacterium]